MTERQRVQLRELADKLQRIEKLNQRLEAANARLVISTNYPIDRAVQYLREPGIMAGSSGL